MPAFASQTAVRQGGVSVTPAAADSGGFTHYAVVYEGLVDVPVDGGYTFHLLSRDGARLTIDGHPLGVDGRSVC